MSRIQQPWRRARLPLGVSVAALLAAPAQAVSFNIGEVEGQFDSTLTVGASWATARPDADLIGANNGGRGLSQTSDDSHLNFKRGETFSKIFKGVHDLELKYRDSGLFLRGKYWYDFELKDEGRPFKAIDDSNRKQGAQASGAELLDAFVYRRYTLGELPGTVRLGRQVVSWGESTFLQGSVNAINPIDVAAAGRGRRPMPSSARYCSAQLTRAPAPSSSQSPRRAIFWVLMRVSRLSRSCWKVIAERSR